MNLIEHDKLRFLKEGWQKELHIVSAGPSLRGFDFMKLKQQTVMTLNNSIFHIPKNIRPKYHVYCEPVENEKENYIKMSQVPYVKFFSIHKFPGWFTIKGFLDSENYAFQVAISIAIKMGYKEVNLYGYDFSVYDGYKYWWSKERDADAKKTYILDMQKIIFSQFIQKISKDIKINIIRADSITSIGDYLNE